MLIVCPHCSNSVWIEEVNCGIFRHAVYKNGDPVNPHASEEECNMLLRNDLVYGCAKPFRLNGNEPEICDYI
jgi:hypothetical protein